MGNIRNTHTTPGVYTVIKSIPRNDTSRVLRDKKNLGEYDRPDSPAVWVFGNMFPAVFS